jgi:hypothetical protein
VGATENLLMAAVLADGTTIIDNAAREPEIVDICAMLTAMGARIEGAGSSTITVEGVPALQPVTYTTVPDRIVAGTWAIGAVMTRGDVVIERAVADHLTVALAKLSDAGAHVDPLPDGLRVAMDGRPRCVDVVTLPLPGFPTDLQPMAVALAAVSTGTALITENVFEGRFMFANELVRLGASVRIDGHHAVVRGPERLSSAPVVATDIRAGAGLVLAGLVSDGVTEVQECTTSTAATPTSSSSCAGSARGSSGSSALTDSSDGLCRTGGTAAPRMGAAPVPGSRPCLPGVGRTGPCSAGGERCGPPGRARRPRGRPAPRPGAGRTCALSSGSRVGEHRAQRQRRLLRERWRRGSADRRPPGDDGGARCGRPTAGTARARRSR